MTEPPEPENQPRWQVLDSLQRRVLGVLVEKAKTTPDAYPMTINAIKTGCNQKSNRHPQMDLAADDVQATLDELREMGVVAEVHGDGRAIKYRHKAYDWLGVDKVEMAVMTELLLRGQQTVGELRSRAARMEPIEGLSELRPVLAGLIQRDLVVALTPEGRGQIVTHGLYQEHERPAAPQVTAASVAEKPSRAESADAKPASRSQPSELDALRQRVDDLTARVAELERQAGEH